MHMNVWNKVIQKNYRLLAHLHGLTFLHLKLNIY